MSFSGIITLFSCGFTLAHYAQYNVSRLARKGTVFIVEFCSRLSETFLYVYLGISALSIEIKYIKVNFIMIVLAAVVVARTLSVFLPILLIFLCNGCKMQLKWNQVGLVIVGGIIRGAIAFALSLQISTPSSGVLKTTT